jgi:hypothetical protein
MGMQGGFANPGTVDPNNVNLNNNSTSGGNMFQDFNNPNNFGMGGMGMYQMYPGGQQQGNMNN